MAKQPKASPLLQAIADSRRTARRTLSARELDAACRAYWEHEGTEEDGPWTSLPEEGRRNVRRRIAAVLAAIGVSVDE
jgi:hypothetical protein